MPAPLIYVETFRLKTPEHDIELGSQEEISRQQSLLETSPQQAAYPHLPFREYTIKSSFRGKRKMFLGKRDPAAWDDKLQFIVSTVLQGEFEQKESEIKEYLNSSGEICVDLIRKIYEALAEKHSSNWASVKTTALGQLKAVFSKLVGFGAIFDHLEPNPQMFADLVNFAFDGQALSTGLLSRIGHDNTLYGFKEFEEKLMLCRGKGIDLNVPRHYNPKFGSFLNYYLAMELKYPEKLIEVQETFRNSREDIPLNYQLRDGYQNTPLLLAIHLRNSKAALAILSLESDKIKVGINMPDASGRTPLQLAAALGLQKVFAKLLALGADATVIDEGRDLDYWANLGPKETYDLLARYIHPDRAEVTLSHPHSQAYLDDDGETAPACLAKDGQMKFGKAQKDHFLILSNEPEYARDLDLAHETLKKAGKKGDKWAAKQALILEKQLDDIRYGAIYQGLLAGLSAQDKVGKTLLDYIRTFPKSALYKSILDGIISFVKTKADKGDAAYSNLPARITSYVETAEIPSSFKLCLRDKQAFIEYFNSDEAKKALAESKAKYLRRACAFGQVELVKSLLQEGVNPNGSDNLKRTAVHYAIMRPDLVRKEYLLQAEEQGKGMPANIDDLVSGAMEAHLAILHTLKTYSLKPVNFAALNKANNSAKDILSRESNLLASAKEDKKLQTITDSCLKFVLGETTAKPETTLEVNASKLTLGV